MSVLGAVLFFGTAPALGTDLHAIFDCDYYCQDRLAHALHTMAKFGKLCLSRPPGSVVNVGMLQLIVEDNEELNRMPAVAMLVTSVN